jgi:hypothetical protein
MAYLYNLARMTTATTGTGTITLGSAVTGFLTFALAGVQTGEVVSYAIKDSNNSEQGTGTYTSAGTTLTRSVITSTNSNNAISLSGSGVEVFLTPNHKDIMPGYAAYGPFNTLASASTADLSTVKTAGVSITGTTTITSFGTGANLLRIVKFAGALTLTHNSTTLIIPGGSNITTAAGDIALCLSDASGNWTVLSYTRGNGIDPVTNGGTGLSSATAYAVLCGGTTSTGALQPIASVGTAGQVLTSNGAGALPTMQTPATASVVGAFSNLAISTTGTSATVTVTADEIALENGSNAYSTVRSVSLSINSAGSGANGLDTGVLAINTWYAVWVINNGSTTSGLLSLSSTAPTMPGGYTYKARVGWIRTDGTGNKYPLSAQQKGRQAVYKIASGSNVTAYPSIASGVVGDTSIPTYVSSSVSTVVPSTASVITIMSPFVSASTQLAAPNNNFGGYNSTTIPPPHACASQQQKVTTFALESTNIYVSSSTASGNFWCIGWEDNL